jgi:hypothetical protein
LANVSLITITVVVFLGCGMRPLAWDFFSPGN